MPDGNAAEKNRWQKFDVLLRAFATPLTVAIVGFLASSYLNRQQTRDTNARTFAEITSRYEDGSSSLRRDISKTLVEGVLNANTANSNVTLLKLEMLASNAESVDLTPVFEDVYRQISADAAHKPDYERSRARLEKVARSVVAKQIEALKTGFGSTVQGSVDFDAVRQNPYGLQVIDQVLRLDLFGDPDYRERSARRFRLEVLSYDVEKGRLVGRLVVSPPPTADEEPEVDMVFSISPFDFPETHNTSLSEGARCTVVMTHRSEESAEILLLYYPGREKVRAEELRRALQLR